MNIFNLDPRFQRRILQGFRASVTAIEQQVKREIEEPKWAYPRETQRRNGDVVGSPRDIVDTGELRDSLYSTVLSDFTAQVATKAPHSVFVHEGYFTTTGKEVPARPYLRTGVDQADRLGLIQEAFNREVGQ